MDTGISRRDALKTVGAISLATIAAVSAEPATKRARMPLEEFVEDPRRVAALRKGVKEMKKRKQSDPLSWFFQAAIHGVAPEAVQAAAKDDPGVNSVFQKRYWNQCPHNGEESANFLPWHRGYTFYFERILRMHTEDDSFCLREGLGGAVADEKGSTRGLLESYPHDQIHRAVGGIIGEGVGAMASPPTAGFDPIFPVHHSNIDWLWAQWSLMPGKKWGKFPSAYWFNERPWFFFDTDGKVVNEPRKAYFDYRAMGIRFKHEDLTAQPLRLPADIGEEVERPAEFRQLTRKDEANQRNTGAGKVLASIQVPSTVLTSVRSAISIPAPARQQMAAKRSALKGAADGRRPSIGLRLRDVRLGLVRGTGFDVHLAEPNIDLTRSSGSFLGSVPLFTHGTPGIDSGHLEDPASAAGHGEDAVFDITKVLAGTAETNELNVVLVPYSLLTVPGRETLMMDDQTLHVGSIEVVEN